VLAFFGLVPTVIYCTITFGIAVVSGIVLEERNYIRFVKPVGVGKTTLPPGAGSGCCAGNPVLPENVNAGCCPGDARTITQAPRCGCSCGAPAVPETSLSGTIHARRVRSALSFSLGLFRQVLPYLILGAAIGAFIYGFVPEDLIVSLAGPENPLAIPVAAIIGIPMYIRAETIIPISAVLLAKGMGLGAVMALIIGGAGASLPEVTLLASIFERRLVATFVAVVLGVAISAGIVLQVMQTAGLLG